VTEREAVLADLQDPLFLGGGQGVEPLAEQLLGQPELDGRGHHRQLLDGGAAGGVEPVDPGQHGIGHGGRDGDAGGRECLGDVERVATGERVQRGGVPTAAFGEPGHRVRRERLQGQPVHRGRRECPEHPPQGMCRRDLLVTEGQHQQRGQVDEPARDVVQHVQGRIVGPVQVLDDENGRAPRGELGDRGPRHRVGLTARECRRERAVCALGGLAQGAERSRAQQVVAGSDEHAHAVVQLGAQNPHDARLADPGLAGDERGAAPPGGGRADRRAQDRQDRPPLAQVGLPWIGDAQLTVG
jgi:hypothetical protein